MFHDGDVVSCRGAVPVSPGYAVKGVAPQRVRWGGVRGNAVAADEVHGQVIDPVVAPHDVVPAVVVGVEEGAAGYGGTGRARGHVRSILKKQVLAGRGGGRRLRLRLRAAVRTTPAATALGGQQKSNDEKAVGSLPPVVGCDGDGGGRRSHVPARLDDLSAVVDRGDNSRPPSASSWLNVEGAALSLSACGFHFSARSDFSLSPHSSAFHLPFPLSSLALVVHRACRLGMPIGGEICSF